MVRPSTPKSRLYLAELVCKAWEDVELPEVIAEAIGGMAIAYFQVRSGLAEGTEMKGLIFECVGCAILVPFLAFLIRVIFVTPMKLYKELPEKKERAKALEMNVLPPQESHIIGVLLGVCAVLAVSLVVVIIPSSTKEKPASPTKEVAAVKPLPALPDKIIPQPESSPAIQPTQPLATIAPPSQFETNDFSNEDTNDPFVLIAKTRADSIASAKAAEIAADQLARSNALKRWTNSLPAYNRAIEFLYDVLYTAARQSSDGISKTVGYYQCLPPVMIFESGKSDVAEIRFQQKTNVDFTISITQMDFHQARGLEINCTAGQFAMMPFGNPGRFFRLRTILTLNDYPELNKTKPMSADEYEAEVKQDLKLLVACQIKHPLKISP